MGVCLAEGPLSFKGASQFPCWVTLVSILYFHRRRRPHTALATVPVSYGAEAYATPDQTWDLARVFSQGAATRELSQPVAKLGARRRNSPIGMVVMPWAELRWVNLVLRKTEGWMGMYPAMGSSQNCLKRGNPHFRGARQSAWPPTR
jgi:hypothetical protein